MQRQTELDTLGDYLKGAARGEKHQPKNRHERRAEEARARRRKKKKERNSGKG